MLDFPTARDCSHLFLTQHSDFHNQLLSYAAFDVANGHSINWCDDASWFMQASNELRSNALEEGSTAFLDTTTLNNALQLISKRKETDITAGSILDLATFATAAVFEDRVIFLESNEELNNIICETLGSHDFIKPIKWTSVNIVEKALTHIWDASERFNRRICEDVSWVPKLQNYWTKIIGRDIPKDFYKHQSEFRRHFSSMTSMAMRRGIKSAYHDQNFGLQESRYWIGADEDFAAESTIRAIFSMLVANSIGATYYSNAYRAQIRALVSERGIHSIDESNQKVIDFLSSEFWKCSNLDAKELLNKELISIPFALTAAIRRATEPSQILEEIVNLRNKSKSFRLKRAELNDAFLRGDIEAIRKLKNAVTTEAAALGKAREFAGRNRHLKALFSAGGARPIIGSLGILIANLPVVPDDIKAILRARTVRPELWFLTELAAEAREAADTVSQLLEIRRKAGIIDSNEDKAQLTQELNRLAGT